MPLPFATDPRLSSQFPSPERLKAALSGASHLAREIFARLWVTEGFPFAFLSCPATYEDLRGWLGSELSVHPKEITLIGSARAGYSLARPPEFGRPFRAGSDLDFSMVSSTLFQRVASEFASFVKDYKEGAARPRTERERNYWDANVEFGRRNIPR